MAPIDRQQREQRRLERIRGAGVTNAITDFSFNFNLGPPVSKQSSLPPPSSRRTPTPKQQTPRARNSSAKRHRSASVQGSSNSNRHATPKAPVVTPQLGKRKRGSQNAQTSEDDGELDELSPDRVDEAHSIERASRVVGTVSPIREEGDDEPDELTLTLESAANSSKHVAGGILASVAAPTKTPEPLSSTRAKSTSADRNKTLSIRSRPSARRSKSAEAPPETPTVLPLSARSAAPTTPSVVPDQEEEDELTPAQASVTPRVVGKASTIPREQNDVDELSPVPPAATKATPTPIVPEEHKLPSPAGPEKRTAPTPAKRGRRKRIVVDDEDVVRATSETSKPRQKKTSLDMQGSADADHSTDEISPEANRTRRPPSKPKQASPEEPVELSSADEEPAEDELRQEDESTIRVLPIPKEKPAKPANKQSPRKKPKFSGPKQAISVMRIKGSTVKGITVADTTRTILEENIDHQVKRMAAKMQTAEDSSRRRKLRGNINIALAFKESLVEKLMDLQDANDSLSVGFKKRKLLRKNNLECRKEILRIQNKRHEVALEMDAERAVYDAEKERVEAKSQLSANMFEIQAAIQSGRERARREGREDEGPDRPLSMLLETVGRHVGAVGGGLLATIRHFNDGLERAAGTLEGRA